MPNWCYNDLSLSHEDPAMEERVRKAIRNNCLFNEFVPRPKEEEDNWHEWNIKHWGTKWDANFEDLLDNDENDGEIDLLNLYFTTAWASPIKFYETMTTLGFKVNATYTVEGGEFAGGFENGEQFYTDVFPSDDEDDEEDEDDEIVEITERIAINL